MGGVPTARRGGPCLPRPLFIDMKYGHIIDYLCTTVGPNIDKAGLSDQRVNKLTEAGIAKAFRRYICGMDGDEGCDYFKVDDDGLLYVYNERYFEMVPEETLLEIVREVMERCDVGLVYQTGSAKIVWEYCKNRLLGDERCKLAVDRRYVCFTNGVYDLKEMRLKDFSVEYKTDMVLDFNYVDGLESALWNKVLAQTVPDGSMRETFHQFCGCFLANRKEFKIEYICFVTGDGQNGKSIICRAVVNMLGPGVATSYNPEQLFKSGQKDYHLANVNGKVVNYCDEVSNKDFSGGDFKQFVSGGEFVGRHPYSQKPTKVNKIPLMLCCANKIPPTTDDTDGYFRRFLIILAPNRVDDRDKDPMLEMKLQAPEVKAAIFNWMLDGYRTFLQNEGKIDIAESVHEVVEEMRKDANSLQRWWETRGFVVVEPKDRFAAGWKSLKEWIADYKEYCEDWGDTPKNRKAVTDLFKKKNVAMKRRSDGVWYYLETQVEIEKEEQAIGDDILDVNLPF